MILTAIFSFTYWFFLSIPVGAIQIEIARRAFNGYFKSAIAVVIGSTVSDFIYGLVALLGLFRFLTAVQIRPYFWCGGSILLILLGLLAIRNYRHPHEVSVSKHYLLKKRYSLVTGFFIAASNPLIIIGWLTGAEFAHRLGLLHEPNVQLYFIFILFGALGLGAYLALIAVVLYRVRHFLSEKLIRITSLAFGILLIGIGLYFLFEAISAFNGHIATPNASPNSSLVQFLTVLKPLHL